jgi:hypothetical protein
VGITEAEFQSLLHGQPTRSSSQKARGLAPHIRGKMNGTEAAYEMELKALQAAGKVLWYAYESIRFLVGKDDSGQNAWFTPDFTVLGSDGFLEVVDVKGGGPIQEASLVRIKATALHFPVRVVIATKQKNGSFERRVL